MNPRSLLPLLLCLLLGPSVRAQVAAGSFEDIRKKDRETLQMARQTHGFGEYQRSLPFLDDLIGDYPNIAELYFMRAGSLRNVGKHDLAIGDLRRGLQLRPDENYAHRELGLNFRALEAYDQAADAFDTYLNGLGNKQGKAWETARRDYESARFAADAYANPVPFDPDPLGPGVNTPGNQEYFPSLSVDGQQLIFTRNVRGFNEDFYESTRQEDGSWSRAQPLNVNTDNNEAAQTITADGRLLVFTACDRRDSRGGCDLYFTTKTGETWSTAQNLGDAVNTRWRETQPSLSANGEFLFFASNRSGGLGKHDLYVSARQGDGWGKPFNLGPTINTTGEDLFPFWAPDGKSLYFTSTGHLGLGGADLFVSRLTTDNAWGKPVNLGYPINTSKEETNLFIGLDGRTAFYSKSEVGAIAGGRPDVDIYTFELPEALRPGPATYLELSVTDASTGQPLSATVSLRALADTTARSLQTQANGKFLTVLPAGKDYTVYVDEPGYLYHSERFNLRGDARIDEPFRVTVALQPLETPVADIAGAEADGAIALRNVLFATGSAELLDVSEEEIARLAGVLERRPLLRVVIAGHTDDVGDEAANLELSEARAAAVREALIALGVEPARVTTEGYGESRPLVENDSPENRGRNRRVTFRLLEIDR